MLYAGTLPPNLDLLDTKHQIVVTIFALSSDLIISMKSLLTITLSIIGGWLGWWLGGQIGLFTALLISMIGTGIGIYAGRRIAQQFD